MTMLRYRTTAMSVSLLALALAGCSKSAQDMTAATASPSPDSGLPTLPAALPMQTGPASQITTAPPATALPAPRRYVGVARPANDRDAYAYLDRASDTEDEIGDAPPDYDYDYDGGVRPWVWETANGDYQYAEPVDGGYRYYYYQPGAEYPYLVRTRDYSYAYAGGALVAIYALNGALLPPDRYGQYRDQASRFFSRGEQLRQYSDQRPHQGIIAANWAARRAEIAAAQANWAADRAQQSAWQSYHAQHDPSQQPGWQQEHQQRQQVAQQFAGWQSRGLSGPPPQALAVPGPRAVARQPANAHAGFASPNGAAGPQPAAGREQHLTGPAPDQRQPGANPRLSPEAGGARHEAAAQQEAAARQNVEHQQANVAQEHVAASQQRQQRAATEAAQQAQLHAMAAQRHAETARAQESRVQPQAMHEHAQPAPAARERAPEMAPRPEARAPMQRPPEARPPAPHMEAPHAQAPHMEAPHPEQAHPAPGHGEPGHENEHHEQ
jgi:hypothetical protein